MDDIIVTIDFKDVIWRAVESKEDEFSRRSLLIKLKQDASERGLSIVDLVFKKWVDLRGNRRHSFSYKGIASSDKYRAAAYRHHYKSFRK